MEARPSLASSKAAIVAGSGSQSAMNLGTGILVVARRFTARLQTFATTRSPKRKEKVANGFASDLLLPPYLCALLSR